jgi:DNA-3-methyladenine glycosylase
MKKLTNDFYRREDVVQLSRELLGKVLVTNIDGKRTAGVITETEAYKGPEDKACHAHLNRFTKRTKVMFAAGNVAYVYLCYGIHHLFNIVTGKAGDPHAILIRAIEPIEGVEIMLERRNMEKISKRLTSGPGTLSKALGISKTHYGLSLLEDTIWIEDRNIEVEAIVETTRIGIDYAEEHALLPWRFYIKNNKWISKK